MNGASKRAAVQARAATVLTSSRGALAMAVGAVACVRPPGGGPVAAILVALAAATDAADGPLARRAGSASLRGARLDSAADALIAAAAALAIVRLIPAVWQTPGWVAAAMGAALAARCAALAAWRARHGVWLIAHTWANKATGMAAVVAVIVALAAGRLDAGTTLAACALAVASGLDEAVLAVRAPGPRPDAAGAWRA